MNNETQRKLVEFVPERLRQARLTAGLSAADLADRIGVTRQLISLYETGRPPSKEGITLLGQALGVDRSYFYMAIGEMEKLESAINFRALKRSPVTERQRARAFIEWTALLASNVSSIVQFPEAVLPGCLAKSPSDITLDEIEGYAADTRKLLGLGVGPISNLTLLLENHGIIVAHAPLAGDMDGLSAVYAGRPIIVVKQDLPLARGRFDIAHELAHLVLHRSLSQEEFDSSPTVHDLLEKQAHRFAGAFLMPESGFVPEAFSLSFSQLIELKKRWGVSIAAMVRRLKDLDVISEQQYRGIQVSISRKNWRREEPEDAGSSLEQPRLLRRAAEYIANNKLAPFHEVFIRSRLPRWFLTAAAGLSESELTPPTTDSTNILSFKLRNQ